MSFVRILLSVLLLALAAPSRSHVAISSNPFAQQGCTSGFDNLEDSWAILGALLANDHVGVYCFDGAEGDRIRAVVAIPPKAAYEGPNDLIMALVGPALPAPAREVPLGLFGNNGVLFSETNPDQGSFPKRNFLGNWHGPLIDVTLPVACRYEIRVFSPSGWRGEYMVVTDGMDPTRPSANINNTQLPAPGDLNEDGKVTVQDAITALVYALEIQVINDTYDLYAADIAPLGDPDRFLIPGDGVVDLGDVVRILRRAVGLDTSLDWPDF